MRASLPGLDETCSLIFSTPIVTPISLTGLKHLLDVIRLQATTHFQDNLGLVRSSVLTQKERQREEALHETAQEMAKLLAVQTRTGGITEDGKDMLAALYAHLGQAIQDGLSLVSMGGNLMSVIRSKEADWFNEVVDQTGAPTDGSMIRYKDGLQFDTYFRNGIPFLTEVEIADPEKEKEGDHVSVDFDSLTEAELVKIIKDMYALLGSKTTHQLQTDTEPQEPNMDELLGSMADLEMEAALKDPKTAEMFKRDDEWPPVPKEMITDSPEKNEVSVPKEPNPFKMKMLQYLAGTMKDLPVDALAEASDEDMLAMIHQHCKSKGMAPPAPGEPVMCHQHCQDPLEEIPPRQQAAATEEASSDQTMDESSSYKPFEEVDANVPSLDSGLGEEEIHDVDMENPTCKSIEENSDYESIGDVEEFDISQVDGPGDEPPPPKKNASEAKKETKDQDKPPCGREHPTVYMFTNPRIHQARQGGRTAQVHIAEAQPTASETYKKWMNLFTDPNEEGNLTPRRRRILQWEQEEQLVAAHKYLRLPADDKDEETKATREALWSKMADTPRCMDCVEKHKYATPCNGEPKFFNGHPANTLAYFYYHPPHAREADDDDEPCKRCTPLHGSTALTLDKTRVFQALPVWDAGLLSILPHCGAWTSVTGFDKVEGQVVTTYLHHELINNQHCFYLNRPHHAAPFDAVMRTINAILPKPPKLIEAPEYDLLSKVIDYQAKILEEIMKCDERAKDKPEQDDSLSGIAIIFTEGSDEEKDGSSEDTVIWADDELPDIVQDNEAPGPSHLSKETIVTEADLTRDLEDPTLEVVTVEVATSMSEGNEGKDTSLEKNDVEDATVEDSEYTCGWCRSMSHSWRTCRELTEVMEQLTIVDANIRQEEEMAKTGQCDTPDETIGGPLSLRTFRGIIKRRQRRRDAGEKEELPKFLTRRVNGVPLIVQVAIEEQLNAIHALCVDPTEEKEILPLESPLVEKLINPLLCLKCWDNHAVCDPCANYKENPFFLKGEDPWTCVRVLYPFATRRDDCSYGFADFRVLDGGYFEKAVRTVDHWEERCTLLREKPITSRMLYTREIRDAKADFYVIQRDTLSEIRATTAADVVERNSPLWANIMQVTASPMEIEHAMKKQLMSILQLSCLEEVSNTTAKRLASFIHSPLVCSSCGSRHQADDLCTWNIPLVQSGARFNRTIRVRKPTKVGHHSELLEITDISGAEFATLPPEEKKSIAAVTFEYNILDGGAFVPYVTDRLARTLVHRFKDVKGDKIAVMVMTKPNCFEIEVADSSTDLQLQWFRGTTFRASTIPQLDAVMPRTLTLLSQRIKDRKRQDRPMAQAVRRTSGHHPSPRPSTSKKPDRGGWRTPDILNPDVLELLSNSDPTNLDIEDTDNDVFPPPIPKRKNKKLWINVAEANRHRDSVLRAGVERETATEAADVAEWSDFFPLPRTQAYLLEGTKDIPRLDRLETVARTMECSLPSRDLSVTQRRQIKRHVIHERRRRSANKGYQMSPHSVSKKSKMINHLPSLYTYPPEDVRGDIVIIPLGKEIRDQVPETSATVAPLIGPLTVDTVLHQQLNAIHELCRDVAHPDEQIERIRNLIISPALCVHCLEDHPVRLPLCRTVKEHSPITSVRRGTSPTKRHVRVTWCDSHYSLPQELCKGCQDGDCPVNGLHVDNRACLSVVFTLVDGGAIDRMMNSATYRESWRYRRQTDPNTGVAQNTIMHIRWHPHAPYGFPLTSAITPGQDAEVVTTPPSLAERRPLAPLPDSPSSPPPPETQGKIHSHHLQEKVDQMGLTPMEEDEPRDHSVQLSLRANYSDLSRQLESEQEPIRFSITVHEGESGNVQVPTSQRQTVSGAESPVVGATTVITKAPSEAPKVPEWYADPHQVDAYVQAEDMEKLISIWKQKGVVQPSTLTNPGGLFNLRPECYHSSAILPATRFCTACRQWHSMITGTCTMDQFLTFERSRATPEYKSLPAEIRLMILKDRFARFHRYAYQLDTPEAKRPRDPAYLQVFTSLWQTLPEHARPKSFLNDLIDEAYAVPPGFTSCRLEDVVRWKAGPSVSPWDSPQRYGPSILRSRDTCHRPNHFPRQQSLNHLRRQSRAWPKPRLNSCGCWGQRRDVFPHGRW